jgi:hypothetical protein
VHFLKGLARSHPHSFPSGGVLCETREKRMRKLTVAASLAVALAVALSLQMSTSQVASAQESPPKPHTPVGTSPTLRMPS